ncbi:MAG: BatA domain-containing protein [Gemmatimonadetes bacterium]|nr:BatA domain-containing protein [Gemmatimonadota bacterium]
MSLTFLVPLFLLGLAGIVIPVVLHLTRRRRRNVVLFPSLVFLRKVPFQEQSRRRVEHWLLLALRALALGLLAVAFARPLFQNGSVAAAGGSGPREVVVLLDQSYSMGVGDAFARAVAAAGHVFDGLGPLDRASLVTFSRGARVLVRSTTDPTRLRSALDTVRVGSGVTRFGPALKVAETILEESRLPSGDVVLISDFQKNGWTGNEDVHLPAGAKLTPVDVAGTLDENVQVADVTLARQALSGRERVTPTARIVRQGGRGPRQVPVTLELEGQTVQTRTVPVPADGAASVTFAPFTLSLPHTRGAVSVPDDGLAADDARYFVASPGSAIPVSVLEGSRTGRNASLYLREALDISPDDRFTVRVRRSDEVRGEDLSGAAVLVLNDTRLDGASAQRVSRFVEAGGGVLVVLGQEASWPASAADILPGTVGGVQDPAEGQGGRLGFLDHDSPIFEVFARPRSGDFTAARFFRARAFQPADSARVLARYDDGTPALVEGYRGKGTVLVWTSTLDQFWNDLALQPVFLPFVQRMLEYLSGRGQVVPWLTAGQVLNLADPKALESAGLSSPKEAGLEPGVVPIVLSPSGSVVPLPKEGPRYLTLEDRGFYTVRPEGVEPTRPFVIAVNVDLSESKLEHLDPAELAARVTAPAGAVRAPPSGNAAELRREDLEKRQSAWRYLLYAAFGLLLLDTALSNWMSRRRKVPGPVVSRS